MDCLCEGGFVNDNYLTNSSFADEYLVREEVMCFKDKYREPLFRKDFQNKKDKVKIRKES